MKPIVTSLDIRDSIDVITAKLWFVVDFCAALGQNDKSIEPSLDGLCFVVQDCISDLETISETAKKF